MMMLGDAESIVIQNVRLLGSVSKAIGVDMVAKSK
jgi:hypothetical protein